MSKAHGIQCYSLGLCIMTLQPKQLLNQVTQIIPQLETFSKCFQFFCYFFSGRFGEWFVKTAAVLTFFSNTFLVFTCFPGFSLARVARRAHSAPRVASSSQGAAVARGHPAKSTQSPGKVANKLGQLH